MTEHAAPQEDRPDLPAAWAAKLLPRRGKRPGTAPATDPDAPDLLAEQLEVHADLLAQLLVMKRNRRHRAAIEAFTAGEPDALGAAAVGELLRYAGPHTAGWWTRLEFDAWRTAHGLPWAVGTLIERYALQVDHSWHPDGTRPPHWHLRLTTATTRDLRNLDRDLDNGFTAEVRAALAAASDEEYGAVVAAAAAHRDDPVKRLAAALLLPTEHDWVLQSCTEFRPHRGGATDDRILYHAAGDAAHLAAAGLTEMTTYELETEHVAALIDSVGAASLPILLATLDSRYAVGAADRRTLIRAVALLPGDAPAAALVARLDEPYVFDGAVESARRHPGPLLRAVAAAAAGAPPERLGPLTTVAAEAGPLDGHPADLREAIAGLADLRRTAPDADPADLPALLTAPPWTVKRRRPKPVVLDLEPIGGPRLVWSEEEAERSRYFLDRYGNDAAQLASWYRFMAARTPGVYDHRLAMVAAYGPDGMAHKAFPDWAALADQSYPGDVEAILHRHGTAAIAPALLLAERWGFDDHLMPVFSAEAARWVAGRFARRKTERAAAAQWFERHGLAAATVLVPDALGADRRNRQAAEAALFHLAAVHGDDAVIAAAEPYGPEAVAGVTALFALDPLDPRGAKVPKPGPWAAPVMFPQVLLKGRDRALPEASVRHLLTVLALAAPDQPYAGLDVVAETCDRASLARFGRAVFEQWLAVGAPAKDQWALTQLAHFAEDETVWMLAPRLREWPGEGQHRRAVAALKVLGAIGSEEALRAIQTTAATVRFEALGLEAGVQIERIAAELGLTQEQLADRVVPDFGLGEEGARTVDYGPRRFTVGFDEALRPFVIDESGKARKTLPKPGAKDDPAVAEDAYRRFLAFRKELKSVAAEQVKRLERAMIGGRTWGAAEFRRYCVEHALTGILARRLVWLADHKGQSTAFRIAEDGSFGDAADDAFDLPDDAAVRLAHPALLGGEAAAWAELFADYEILQPFDQLARPVMAFTEEELATGVLTRFEGATVETGRLLGLAKRGWHRAYPGDGGLVPGFTYFLASRCFLVLTVEPGIAIGYAAEYPQQTVVSVRCNDHEGFGGDPVPITARLDPVPAAEALASLARLVRA
ncbi:hypothetical protein GCM10009853_013730 [Glycomyces scopariae]